MSELSASNRQEESRIVNLSRELSSEQFAYRQHMHATAAEAGADYAGLLKHMEQQLEQATQAHRAEVHNLTGQRNESIFKSKELEDHVRFLTTKGQTAQQESETAQQRVEGLDATLRARDQELRNIAKQLVQAEGIAVTAQYL